MNDALKILIIISSFILANNLKSDFRIQGNVLSFELEDREYSYQNEGGIMYSYISHLECSVCEKEFPHNQISSISREDSIS